MRKLMLLAAALASLVLAATATAATVVVNPANEDGWTAQHSTCGAPPTASQAFVSGPGNPPAGKGSREFRIGPNGDSFETYRNRNYNGMLLEDLTELSYWTYVQQNNSGQAVYLNLLVDWNNDGVTDDQLFFEPVYQNGDFGFPDQSDVTVGVWQKWDAMIGGWWALSAGTFGPPLVSLEDYIAAHPGARLTLGTVGSIRLAAGCGGAAWANFVGNADAVTIGFNGQSTTYDFELAIGPPTSKEQCKNGGWRTFDTPRRFKNQGDCIQFVNTGK